MQKHLENLRSLGGFIFSSKAMQTQIQYLHVLADKNITHIGYNLFSEFCFSLVSDHSSKLDILSLIFGEMLSSHFYWVQSPNI